MGAVGGGGAVQRLEKSSGERGQWLGQGTGVEVVRSDQILDFLKHKIKCSCSLTETENLSA